MSSPGLLFDAAAAAAVVVSAVAQVASAAAAAASAVNPVGTAGTADTAAGAQSRRDQRPLQLEGLLLGHMEKGSPFHTVVGSTPLVGPLWEAGE